MMSSDLTPDKSFAFQPQNTAVRNRTSTEQFLDKNTLTGSDECLTLENPCRPHLARIYSRVRPLLPLRPEARSQHSSPPIGSSVCKLT